MAGSLRASVLTRPMSTGAVKRYTKDHEWISVSGGIGTFGITDYAQKALGDVVYIELPEVGAEIAAHDQIGAVESVKAASDMYAPVSGTIVEVNGGLEQEPSLVNLQPYTGGWIAKIRLANEAEELDVLMDEAAYAKHTSA